MLSVLSTGIKCKHCFRQGAPNREIDLKSTRNVCKYMFRAPCPELFLILIVVGSAVCYAFSALNGN